VVASTSVKRQLATRSLRLIGWEYEGDIPREKKAVALALPHTSNWDAPLLVLLTRSIGIDMEWMLKDDWMRGPLRPVMRSVGAVGIDRSHARNVVDQMVERFRTRDTFVLGIPPEGTRSRAEYWKSGFYHIALGAKVPVLPGYLDYSRKRASLGPAIHLTGDVRADMDVIRAFYAKQNPVAYDPSRFGPIRLREEA
jgi:1-acyl-sn-glycerol-3-phosphate acyltransferase